MKNKLLIFTSMFFFFSCSVKEEIINQKTSKVGFEVKQLFVKENLINYYGNR